MESRLTKLEELRKNNRPYYKCRCKCGNIVEINKYKFLSGHTKSCGCLKNDILMNRNIKHNLSKTKFYKLFHQIKNRCYNKNNQDYKYYGKKNVKICDEWLNDINKFIEWCNISGYKKGLTIDRINPTENYEPNNCQWITISEQQSKRRDTIKIKIDNIEYTLKELSKKYNKSLGSIRSKYYKNDLESFIKWL